MISPDDGVSDVAWFLRRNTLETKSCSVAETLWHSLQHLTPDRGWQRAGQPGQARLQVSTECSRLHEWEVCSDWDETLPQSEPITKKNLCLMGDPGLGEEGGEVLGELGPDRVHSLDHQTLDLGLLAHGVLLQLQPRAPLIVDSSRFLTGLVSVSHKPSHHWDQEWLVAEILCCRCWRLSRTWWGWWGGFIKEEVIKTSRFTRSNNIQQGVSFRSRFIILDNVFFESCQEEIRELRREIWATVR